jgi:hypothetical protein
MAPEFGKPIHQLPLIPAKVLEKHCVHEPLDPRFRSAARRRSINRKARNFPLSSFSLSAQAPIDRRVEKPAGFSHSRSFDQRRRPETFLTAIATAFFCPSRSACPWAGGPKPKLAAHDGALRAHVDVDGARNKEERLAKHLHFFVDGRIYVLKNQPWTVDFRNELVRFPVGRYDDQVDALTLYLEYMFSKPPTRPCILSANSWEERMARAMGAQPLRKGEHPMRPRGPNRGLRWRG